MFKRNISFVIVGVLVLCFICALNVSASTGEATDYKPIADEMIGSSGINWLPKIEYARLDLTVARPDGTIFKKTFQSGSTSYISLSDIHGDSNSCDGSYTYELRVIPTADKENLRRKPLTQTGYFSVQGGAIKVPKTPNEDISRTMDITHNDDVIITGHLCVGSGCTEDMYFGLDRVVISGATPWVYFKDTSDGYIFPTNDWRIIINDGTSGADLFSIEDADAGKRIFTLEAGAPANSLYINEYGRVGMGTSTPGYPLELETTGENATIVLDRTDGAATYMNATSSFSGIGSIRNHPLRLLTNSSWKMKINTDGTLDMRDGGSYDGTWNPASSRELKENIESLATDEAIEALEGLNPVKFNYKVHKDEARVGFIAEDVPELVAMNSRKTLGTVDIMAVLTKVVQEQQKIIIELKKKVAELEKK